MRITRRIVLSMSLVLSVSNMAIADELFDQKTLDRSNGQYTVSIKGFGEFGVDKLEVRTQKKKKCSVHVGSLKKGIRAAFSRKNTGLSVGSKAVISLKLDECLDLAGNTVMCCKGRGNLCSVSVTAVRVF